MQKQRAFRVSGLAFSLLLIACFFIQPATHTQAQETEDEIIITHRDGDITILQNGNLEFRETWDVSFVGGPHTSLMHEIDDNGFADITNWSVSEDEQAYTAGEQDTANSFRVQQEGHARRITWFFPPTTNTARTFTLRYTVVDGMRIYAEGDLLRWNFIERQNRPYPIESAQVVVHLPAAFDVAEIQSETYRYWVRNEATDRIVDGETVEFAGEAFRPGDAWEIRVRFPHGVVTASPPAWQLREDAEQQKQQSMRNQLAAQRALHNRIAINTVLIIILVGILINIWLWFRFARTRPAQELREHQTSPPDNLPAGLAGTLIDERIESQEMTATLIDLAQRGYLRIKDAQTSGTHSFTFERGTGDTSSLRPYEQRLLRIVLGEKPQRNFSAVQAGLFKNSGVLKQEMYEELVQKGYFSENPDALRSRYRGMALVLKFFSVIGALFTVAPGTSHNAPLLFLIPLSALPFGVGMFFLSRAMHRTTQQGATASAKWRGFKHYLEHLQAYAQVGEQTALFAQYLPYAVAFGIQEGWLDTFARVQASAPSWYEVEAASSNGVPAMQEGFTEMVEKVSLAFDRLSV